MRRFAAGLLVGLALPPLALLVTAALGAWRVHATAEPPRWESALARFAFDASVARHAPRVANPITPTDAELTAGMKVFRTNCSGCHGEPFAPSPWGTAGFYPRVPQFAAAPPTRPDWQLYWIVKNGVRYSGMGAWEKLASDREIWLAVTFLSRLRDLPPAVAAEWRKKPAS